MSPEPSSPDPGSTEPPPPPAAPRLLLVLIGRTLRGTLREAFRAEAVDLFDASASLGPDHRMPAPHPPALHTALSRTVELTAVAVTDAGPLQLNATIADPTLSAGRSHAPATAPPGSHLFGVDVEAVSGIHPVAGPPHLDLSRRVTVVIESPERPDLEVRLVTRD
jgi:hypothetical protein